MRQRLAGGQRGLVSAQVGQPEHLQHPGDNRGFYHGVSPGEPERGLMDYFYPEDTRSMFLRKEEQMLQHDKKNNKKASSINKNK